MGSDAARERVSHPSSNMVSLSQGAHQVFAQFYEEISPEQVLKDVQALLERARCQGGKAVALRKSKRLAGYIASREIVNRTGYVSWPLDRIWCAFVLAMAQPHVRLGDVLYRQRNGIPIGGLVSKAATSCVLGVAEDS